MQKLSSRLRQLSAVLTTKAPGSKQDISTQKKLFSELLVDANMFASLKQEVRKGTDTRETAQRALKLNKSYAESLKSTRKQVKSLKANMKQLHEQLEAQQRVIKRQRRFIAENTQRQEAIQEAFTEMKEPTAKTSTLKQGLIAAVRDNAAATTQLKAAREGDRRT